jgi:ubiquinone/menaquinone biosynthesis C-methylase UbiE
MLQEAFDKSSSSYDADFTYSKIGSEQRKQVYFQLAKEIKNCSSVLEVNCGTGEDAIYFSKKGMRVLATDISAKMIEEAKRKLGDGNVKFEICNAIDLEKIDGTFDLVFSNFGGLNCLTEVELTQFCKAAALKLNSKGKLVMVFISSNSFIEKVYFKLKSRTIRRQEKHGVETIIENQRFLTYYYSPEKLIGLFSNQFKVVSTKPIGFFVPPSYFENKVTSRPILFRLFVILDSFIKNWSWLANRADHFYISFEKK